jgi:hypothetical protein
VLDISSESSSHKKGFQVLEWSDIQPCNTDSNSRSLFHWFHET